MPKKGVKEGGAKKFRSKQGAMQAPRRAAKNVTGGPLPKKKRKKKP